MSNLFMQRYLSEKLSLKRMGGNIERLSSTLAKSSIQLNPYQIYAAMYALDSPLQRGAILSDEVGLGKTIEAGIVLSQLWTEGKRRILIICPASIRRQWQDELFNQFGLSSEVIDGPIFLERVNSGVPVPLTYDGIFIVSLHFAHSKIKLIEKQRWSCIVIDEAHRLRNVYKGRDASKMAWDLREIMPNVPRLLLTATPLQNNLMELYGLVSFIDDKILGNPYSFKKNFVDPLSEGSIDLEPKLKELRKFIKGDESSESGSIDGVLIRTLRRQVKEYVKFTQRYAFTQDFTPTNEEVELYEKVSSYLQRSAVAAIQATQRNLMILVYRKLLASSSFAIAGTLKKLINFLEKELILRVNKRDEKEKIDLELIPEAADEGFEEETEELLEEKEDETPHVDETKFSDEDIKKEMEELQSYHNLAISIKKNSKGDALVLALKKLFELAKEKGWPVKAIVFTESTRTQEYLGGLLKENGITYTIFRGSNTSKEAREAYDVWRKSYPEFAEQGSYAINIRKALIYEFESKTQVFLSTEAGGEGLNLQFCNIVVNYDLPWNPQRVEQRIGRCHRYGQKYDVLVANFLNTQNRADQRLLELLQQKLHLFDGLFGSSDEILGLLESGVDFEKRILEIYQSCKTPEEIDTAFDKLQQSLQDRITGEIQQLRSKLTEYFDEPVQELFQKKNIEIGKTLSLFDEQLLKICLLYYENKLRPLDKDRTIFSFKDNGLLKTIAFRELKEDEKGRLIRMNLEHPIARNAIESSLNLKTETIPVNHFIYTNSGKRYSQIESFLNKNGLIYLFKLKISGIEEEELLAPLAFIKEKSDYKPLPLEISEFILTLNAEQQPEILDSSPIGESELVKVWQDWKSQVMNKYQRRNERLYDREIDRINRYYKDYSLRVDDRIKKTQIEIDELSRKRENSADLQERRELHKEIQELTLNLDRLIVEQIKLKQEANELKQKEYEELEKKFEIKTEESLIAITQFKVV